MKLKTASQEFGVASKEIHLSDFARFFDALADSTGHLERVACLSESSMGTRADPLFLAVSTEVRCKLPNCRNL